MCVAGYIVHRNPNWPAVCWRHAALRQLQLPAVYYMQQTFRQLNETEGDSTCICDVTDAMVKTQAMTSRTVRLIVLLVCS